MRAVHKVFYAFMRVLIAPYFAIFGHYRWKRYRPKSKNYLVLTNHNTNYDFFLAGLCLPHQMYFVAMESIFRLGFVSRIIKFLGDPIPRRKGASGKDAADAIVARLSRGDNVCMMVEGNRSFSGETGWISDSNASLLRRSGAGLITYRLHGGYFRNPRWSKKQRRGPMWGEIVREYTPSEIAEMTDAELTAVIRRDLYVNAYDDQKPVPRRYRSKAPAEHLETALFLCPSCHRFSTLHSEKDRLSCLACGLSLTLDEYGYFHGADGKDAPFSTILDWSRWQQSDLKALPAACEGQPDALFFDENIRLYSILPGKGTQPLGIGRLSLYADRLEFTCTETTYSFPVTDIRHMAVSLTCNLLFTAGAQYCEAKSDTPYSALKYLILWRYLAGKDYV